jgi:hypothetical protein
MVLGLTDCPRCLDLKHTRGADQTSNYWNIAYEPNQYNFAQYAIDQGYSVFFYDRLRVGESTRSVLKLVRIDAISFIYLSVLSGVLTRSNHQSLWLGAPGLKPDCYSRGISNLPQSRKIHRIRWRSHRRRTYGSLVRLDPLSWCSRIRTRSHRRRHPHSLRTELFSHQISPHPRSLKFPHRQHRESNIHGTEPAARHRLRIVG